MAFVYVSQKKGLELVITPARLGKDKFGNPIKIGGKRIKFINGKYRTDDKKEIEYLDTYMEANPEELTKIDERRLEIERRVAAKLKERVEEEVKKELEKEVEKELKKEKELK